MSWNHIIGLKLKLSKELEDAPCSKDLVYSAARRKRLWFFFNTRLHIILLLILFRLKSH